MAFKFSRKYVKRIGKYSRINLAIFVILFAAVGTYLIVNSFASPTYGTIAIQVLRTNSAGQCIGNCAADGAQVNISAANGGSWACFWQGGNDPRNGTRNAGWTNPSGWAYFSCNADTAVPGGYPFNIDSSLAGFTSQGGTLARSYPNGNDTKQLVQRANPVDITSFTATPQWNIPYGGSTRLNFSVNWPPADSCLLYSSDGKWNGGWATDGMTVIDRYVNTRFTLTCSSSYGGTSDSYWIDTSVAPQSPPPAGAKINSFSASPSSITSGQQSSLTWSGTNIGPCSMTYSTGSTTYAKVTSPRTVAPTQSTSYTLTCSSSVSGGASDTKSTSITVNGVAPPPPPPPCSTCGGNGGGTVTTSSSSRTVARASTAPANSSDKEKPSTPGNLKAEQVGGGEVELTWDASTDNVGVASYTVERTSDQQEWTMLDDAVIGTTYSDLLADYNTQYSYRVSAQDSAGNFSDYAIVDIKTNEFTANAYADEDSIITSDDGVVTARIPKGALKEDAFCEIPQDTIRSTPKGYKLAAGAYTVTCRYASGDNVSKFAKAVHITMDLKTFKSFKKFTVYAVDEDGKLSPIKAAFDKSKVTMKFDQTEVTAFAAYGSKGGGALWMWILLPLLVIGGIYFIIRMRNRTGGDDNYYDTAGYVTMPPSAPVSPDNSVGGYEHHQSLPEMVAQGQTEQPGVFPQEPQVFQPEQYPLPPQQPQPPLPSQQPQHREMVGPSGQQPPPGPA